MRNALLLFAAACQPLQAYGPDSLASQYDPVEQAFPGSRAEYQGVAEIVFPDGAQVELPFESIEGIAVTGGDMLLGPSDALGNRSASADLEFSVWPSCTMPYEFAEDLSQLARQDFLTAADHWNEAIGMHFVEAPGASDRIRIRNSDGCSSAVGRTGGVQTMRLSAICGVGSIIHEIGHAAGLYHEQARSDSDAFVAKHWDNMQPELVFNFRTWVEREQAGIDHGDYDYGSIMHYPSWAFAVGSCSVSDPSGCTLTHLDGSYITENQRHHLSDGDIASLRRMYDCDGTRPLDFPPPDDHANDFTSATGIQVLGQHSVTGEISYEGDGDMFRLYIDIDGPFSISTSGTTDTVGTLFDANGAVVQDSGAEGGNFTVDHTGSIGEQYFFEVRGATDNTLGAYTLHTEAAEAEPFVEPEVIEIPGAVPVGLFAGFGPASTTASGALVAGQTDVYRVEIESVGPVILTVRSTGSTDTVGTLLDSVHVQLATNDDTDQQNFEVGDVVEAGVYFIEVRGYAPSTSGDYGLVFTAEY